VTYGARPLCLESDLLPYDRRWRCDVTCHGHVNVDELLAISGGMSSVLRSECCAGAVLLCRSLESSFVIGFGGNVMLFG